MRSDGDTWRVDGLRLFFARTPFAEQSGAALDREGAWTEDMLDDLDIDADEGPNCGGLWVWEGSCAAEYSRGYGVLHEFEGKWRAPTTDEIARLAAGRFPLRDRPFPHVSNLDTFEPMEVLVGRAGSGHGVRTNP